jgi:hypothetical protein
LIVTGRNALILAAVWLAASLGASGCTFYPERGSVADFFIKDYDLPEYRADVADFQRDRQSLTPSDATGAIGGFAGAVAGGRRKAWRASASGGTGGMAGSLVGGTFAQAEDRTPLPETYEALALALPVVVTDPNKGPTFGLLPVVVLQESARITNIFAPDITFNAVDGVGGVFRMLRYFSSDSALLIDAGSSSEGYQEYNAVYDQRRIGPNKLLYYQAHFMYRTDLSERFYGLGNETEAEDESTYVFRRTLGEAKLGLELPFDLAVEFREQVASYKIGPGHLDDVESTKSAYEDVNGVDGRVTILNHQIRLIYDSRDSRNAPTEGAFGEFIYDVSDSSLGSDVGFQRFRLSLTLLFPLFDARFVTVARVAGWLMTGSGIPFYEQTQLGGRTTIRGYGQGRFVERNAFVANFEERVRITEMVIAGNRIEIQLAGFVDVGRVFDEDESFTLDDTKIAAGGALRIIIPDSDLVTSIDMGFSDEGSAVFVALDYPF